MSCNLKKFLKKYIICLRYEMDIPTAIFCILKTFLFFLQQLSLVFYDDEICYAKLSLSTRLHNDAIYLTASCFRHHFDVASALFVGCARLRICYDVSASWFGAVLARCPFSFCENGGG